MTDQPSLPPCPACCSVYAYENGPLHVCPECAFEWSPADASDESSDSIRIVRDANGNALANGDDVTVIKDLKIRGTSSVVKVGTKVRNIRLVDSDHDIDCKIDGVGPMKLKSEFVRKA